MKAMILLTGATGFVGREVLLRLLAGGHDVATLVRPSANQSAQRRFLDILTHTTGLKKQPRLIEGDIRDSRVIKSPGEHAWLANFCGSIIHCAADVRFTDDDTMSQYKTNCDGTVNLLNLALTCAIPDFHYVSTAYVSGRRKFEMVTEDFESSTGQTRNYYEESKRRTELIVRRAKWVTSTVYRPAMVIGRSTDGYASSFNSFYHLIRFASLISKMPHMLTSKIKLQLTGDEPVNILHVDLVADVIAQCVGRDRQNLVYQITSEPVLRTRDVYEVLADYFNLPEMEFAGTEEGSTDLVAAFNNYLGPYRDYWGDDAYYSMANTKSIMAGQSLKPVTHESLRRVIEFAKQADFSSKKVDRLKKAS